jgi:hypothetical protein
VTPAPLAVADCERIHAGTIGQPVNALSSLAYVGAGGALMARARVHRLPAGARGRLLAFGATTAANGLGGLAYHGPGGAVSRWLHDAALLATLGVVTVVDVEDLAGETGSRPRALGAVAGGALLALHPAASARAQLALGAGAVAGEVAGHVARRRAGRPGWRRRLVPLVVTGAAAVTVHAASRSGGPLCRPDSVLQGHAAWHVLTALMLWWWGEAALDAVPTEPGGVRPRPCRVPEAGTGRRP